MNINKTLEKYGWNIECQSPFEIRHQYTNSFVSGNHAVHMIYYNIIEDEFIERLLLTNEAHDNKLINDDDFRIKIKECIDMRFKTLNDED